MASKSLRQRSHSQPEDVEVAFVPGQQPGAGKGVDQVVCGLTIDRNAFADLSRRETGFALSDGDQNGSRPCDRLDAGLRPLRADSVMRIRWCRHLVDSLQSPERSEPSYGEYEATVARMVTICTVYRFMITPTGQRSQSLI